MKPSVTSTSHLLRKTSLPSTLPTNCTLAAASKGCAALSKSVPLLASSPMLSRPTRGVSIPRAHLAKAAPMIPCCTRFSGLGCDKAPMSSSVRGEPPKFMVTAMPGRKQPGSVPSTSVAAPTTAPVLPMETAAPAWPALTAPIIFTMDESGLARSAVAGDSCMSMACDACNTRKPGSPPLAASQARMVGSSPTKRIRAGSIFQRPEGSTAWRAPLSVLSGAWSPPGTSRAMRDRAINAS